MSALTGTHHLTAFFDTRDAAEEAATRLRALGLSDIAIRIAGGEEYAAQTETRQSEGFWESISDFFFPNDERETYAEGLRRGGHLVTVSGIPADRYDEVVDILDDEGSVDLDERSESWRAEGWTGADDATSSTGLAGAGAFGGSAMPSADVPATGLAGSTGPTTGLGDGTAASRSDTDEDVIPVIEEQLRVGKRDMSLGRVRVRSYVVEEAVSEDVDLRAEHVEIERRPVDRPVDAGDAAFADRTIEAEERAEEAVVRKEARVTEEIGLRKTRDERTETVSDTVRHTEVEVEDDRDLAGTVPGKRDV